MVYGAVQRHSAEVEIDSAVGKGTTMRLIFAASTNADRTGARCCRGSAERLAHPGGG